jgi:hypothetical protein
VLGALIDRSPVVALHPQAHTVTVRLGADHAMTGQHWQLPHNPFLQRQAPAGPSAVLTAWTRIRSGSRVIMPGALA